MTYVHARRESANVSSDSDSRINHLLRLNSTVCGLWSLSPFNKDGADVPRCANGDKQLEFGVVRQLYYVDPVTKNESYEYFILDSGKICCPESDEVMDLSDHQHLLGVALTIIKDVYGDYDMDAVGSRWIDKVLAEAEEAEAAD